MFRRAVFDGGTTWLWSYQVVPSSGVDRLSKRGPGRWMEEYSFMLLGL